MENGEPSALTVDRLSDVKSIGLDGLSLRGVRPSEIESIALTELDPAGLSVAAERRSDVESILGELSSDEVSPAVVKLSEVESIAVAEVASEGLSLAVVRPSDVASVGSDGLSLAASDGDGEGRGVANLVDGVNCVLRFQAAVCAKVSLWYGI
jgi:hypothetical protein